MLLIDDDVVALDTFRRFFEMEGFEVSIAATGRAGLSLAEQRTFDALVLDLCLPDMSGLAVLARLRDAGERLPVLLVSGFGTLEEGAAAVKLGASDVLSKPLDAENLVTAVGSLISASSAREGPTDAGTAAPRRAAADGVIHDEVLVRKAQLAIEAHVGQADLNLAAVASLLEVSKWRLSRAFSACGSDFRACLRRARMQQAGSRLRDSRSGSVKELAYDVGYRHHSDFTRHFKTHWGMTPKVFREHHQRERSHR